MAFKLPDTVQCLHERAVRLKFHNYIILCSTINLIYVGQGIISHFGDCVGMKNSSDQLRFVQSASLRGRSTEISLA